MARENVVDHPAELETSLLIRLSQHGGENGSCVENAVIEESTFFFFKLLILNTSLSSSLCFFPIVLYFDT